MTYLTYEDYSNMGGTVNETAFTHLEHNARKQIDYETFNRVKAGLEEELFTEEEQMDIKECVFELINLISNNTEVSGDKQVTSMSNDGVSETYKVYKDEQSYHTAISNMLLTYLSNLKYKNIPVLYRGVDR